MVKGTAMSGLREHWEKIYREKPTDQLGWWETEPEASLRLIGRCSLPKDAHILDMGCGASVLIDRLLELGFVRITAVDISATALQVLKKRLSIPRNARVEFVRDDITQPETVLHLPPVDLWHDRAVLHFLVEETDRQVYRTVLRRLVKRGGYVCLATFSLEGARKCSGLPVQRYNHRTLADFLGQDFQLMEWFPYTYHQPSGSLRPYIYALFRRV